MREQKASSGSHHSSQHTRSKLNLLLVVVGLLILAGIIYWGFTQGEYDTSEQKSITTITLPEPEYIEVKPIVPAQLEPVTPPEPIAEELADPVTSADIALTDLDGLLLAAVESLDIGELGTRFVKQPNSIERGAAIIDSLRQSGVPYKILPITRPDKKFAFVDNGLAVTMDSKGFKRYDAFAQIIAHLDIEAIVSLYRQFQEPINEAWSKLGYGNWLSFEQALQQALQEILSSPMTKLQARLVRKETVWVYADKKLEALPPLQKQLMRMGPSNGKIIKDKARELHEALFGDN